MTQKTKHEIFVHTDHKKLLFFLETKKLDQKQIRWLKKLAYYDFAIKYINSENIVEADALNKKPDYENPNKQIKPMLIKNGNYMQITEKIEKNENIIKTAHDIVLIGHQGILKTLKRIQKKTTWKNIKVDVKKYVKNYPICAIKKHDRSRKEKLHQFLQPPDFFFQKPALNFFIGLPES